MSTSTWLTDVAGAPAHNLPLALTSFIGREQEIQELRRILLAARLLTLIGSGGAGKTRLALQVAREALPAYPNGVWLVELGALADPALVPQVLATALGVREAPGRALSESLADYLRPRWLLLILDNCEHLIAACAQLTEALLRACPDLRILATSREGLGIAGETTWRVPSLSAPAATAGRDLSAEQLTQYEAVRLFIERASAQRPFTVTNQNAPAVAQICHRLDGIPLAIELAAARARLFTPEQIAARLDDCFLLLTGGSRTALPRQQTLQATVDWSHDLLSEPERVLLRRLSAFAGGWTFEAAEAICGGPDLNAAAILHGLSGLVDKSLVLAEEQGSAERYRFLETIRQYARDKLLESGESEALRDRHRDYFLALAEEADPKLRSREQLVWIERLVFEQDNLRAALDWSLTRGAAEAAQRLAGLQGWFWFLRGHWTEGRTWVRRSLELPTGDGSDPENTDSPGSRRARARAFQVAGMLAMVQGDFAATPPASEEAVRLFRSVDDPWWAAWALMDLGTAEAFQGQHAAAAARFQEALAMYRQTGEKWGIAFALSVAGFGLYYGGNVAAARAMFEECLALNEYIGDRWVGGFSLSQFGEISEIEGDLPAAEQHLRAALDKLEALTTADTLVTRTETRLAVVLARRGNPAEAAARLKRSLRLVRESGSGIEVAGALIAAAALALTVRGLPGAAHAARLLGATAALSSATGFVFPPVERADFERTEAAARAALGAETFAAPWTAGQALSLEQALAEGEQVAAEVATETPTAAPPEAFTTYPAGLTEREVAVLRLVARGLTSAQVAEGLVISPVTVSTHLRNIYAKIGVNTRAAAARFAVEHGARLAGSAAMLTANVLNNLPIQLTSFIGREREIAEVRRLLGGTRLLTVTGAGGAGKTRLAIEVARQVLDAYADGVWVVELAPLVDPALVPQAVAAALGVQEAPGRSLTEILAEYLRTRSLLLVLDNCEHLVAACAQLADTLLHTAPDLHILATSREPLDIVGETAWRVPSLAVPGPLVEPTVETLLAHASVRLFLERAAAALPTFALADQNAPAVAQVCRRLDGIPLAIELAAARVKALTVEQIAERLDHRFRLLTGGGRTAVPRQQTLHACIDWSYALLSELERSLLRRALSVFAGGFALAAAEAVCNDSDMEAGEILDLLSGLVDKSLVQAEAQGREERYRLLETIREYARDRLAEAAEAGAVRDRHRDYYLALAEEADSHLRGREQLNWIEQLIMEQDNLRAALEWSLGHEAVEAALRLAGAQGCWFWYLRGQWTEGRAWLARCLDLSDRAAAPSGRATSDPAHWALGRALLAAGILAMIQSDFAAAQTHLEAAIPLARSAGDYWGAARSLIGLGTVKAFHAQHDEAAAHLQNGLALFREAGDKWGTAFALSVLLFGAYYRGDLVAARALAEESQGLVLEVGDRWVRGANHFYLGAIAELQGDLAAAEQHIRATLADLEAIKAGSLVNVEAHLRLATILARRGQPAEAAEPLKRGLLLVREFGTATGTVTGTLAAAVVAIAMSDRPPAAEWAAHLVGAAAALSEATGYAPRPIELADLERAEAAARAALGEEAFAAAREVGRGLTVDQALARALKVATLEPRWATDPPPPAPAAGPYPAGLTEREVAVLRLVARGLTSAQVAEDLVISPVTVSTHLRNIYAKLGVNSRAGAARFAVEHGLA